MWLIGIDYVFADRLWFGYGMMGFWTEHRVDELAAVYGSRNPDMHNGFMHLLVEAGLVGVLLFLAMLLSVFLAARWLLQRGLVAEVVACSAFLAAFLLMNLHEYYLMRGTQFLQTLFTYAVVRVGYLYWMSAEADAEPGR